MSNTTYTSIAVSNFGSKHFDMSALRAAFDGCKEAVKQEDKARRGGVAPAVELDEDGEKKKMLSILEPGAMLWGQVGSTGLFVLCRLRSDVAALVLPPKVKTVAELEAEEEEEMEGRKSGGRKSATRKNSKKIDASIYPKREITCDGSILKIQELGYDLSLVRPKSETQKERRAGQFEGNAREKSERKPRKEEPKVAKVKYGDSSDSDDDEEEATQQSRGKRQRDAEVAEQEQEEEEEQPQYAAPSPPKPVKKFAGDCCKFCGGSDHLSRACKNKSGTAPGVTVDTTSHITHVASAAAASPPKPVKTFTGDCCKFCGETGHLSRQCKNKNGGGASAAAAVSVVVAAPAAVVVTPAAPIAEQQEDVYVAPPTEVVVPPRQPAASEYSPFQSRPSGEATGGYHQQRAKAKTDACKYCGSGDHLSRQCKNKK